GRRGRPGRGDLRRHPVPVQRGRRRRPVRAAGADLRPARARAPEGADAVDEGGPMTLTFAALGEFGDAISFIFSSRENQRGAPVGGSHNLPLIWEHLKLCAVAMGLALVVSLPLGLVLGHTGKGSFLAISTSNVGRAVPSVA